MKRIWILGIGPLVVQKLFLIDVKRLDVYIYDVLMPKNEYYVLEKLFLLFEEKYILYTRYITQTLGNNAFETIKEQYENAHIVCKNYSIYVYDGKVEARMYFQIYDLDLEWKKTIHVINKVNVLESKSITLIKF